MIEEQIFEFFRQNPYPSPEEAAAVAEQIGVTPEVFNSKVYELISVMLSGGNSAGANPEEIDPNELALGSQIELEHVDKTSKFSPLVGSKIAMDHIVSTPTYYSQPETAAQDLANEANEILSAEGTEEEQMPDETPLENQQPQVQTEPQSVTQQESLRAYIRRMI
jgi:hypothetical protein